MFLTPKEIVFSFILIYPGLDLPIASVDIPSLKKESSDLSSFIQDWTGLASVGIPSLK